LVIIKEGARYKEKKIEKAASSLDFLIAGCGGGAKRESTPGVDAGAGDFEQLTYFLFH